MSLKANSIPTSVEDITPSWLSQILNTKISSSSFTIQNNIQKGSGFLSCMSRVNCHSEDSNQSFSLVIKLLPESDMRAVILAEKFDETEIQFYQALMPELIRVVPDLKRYLCRSYYGKVQQEISASNQSYSSV